MEYDVSRLFARRVFAMEEGALLTLFERARHAQPSATTSPAARDGSGARSRQSSGGVAVVPVLGMLQYRHDWLSYLFGGTATSELTAEIRRLRHEAGVESIVLQIDSPGGEVSGIPELAAEIEKTRAYKPIIAWSDTFAASAAYWIASAATEVVVSPSGEVGSIGCYCVHVDATRAYDKAGLKPTLIKAGKHKAELSDLAPLSDDTHAYLQGMVDRVKNDFVASVARGRKVSKHTAAGPLFGEGRMVAAYAALAADMVDRVEPFSEATARASMLAGEHRRRAAADRATLTKDLARYT